MRLMKLMGIFLMTILLASCASFRVDTGTPGWIDTLYDRSYPEREYLCAIGAGSTRENAVNAAFSSLSQVFNTRVESTVLTYTSSSASLEGSEVVFSDSESMIDQGSVSTSAERIIGGQTVNTWVAPDGTVWVRVAIDRKKSAALYEKDMGEVEREVAQIKMNAAQAPDGLARYFRLRSALAPALSHQQMVEQVRVLTGSAKAGLLQPLERELDQLAASITLAMDVELTSDAPSSARTQLESAFASLFNDYGFTVTDVVAPQIPKVVISYGAVPVSTTDSPYVHVRYTLAVQVYEQERVVASYRSEQRETALTLEDAMQRALRSALNNAVGSLGSALGGE